MKKLVIAPVYPPIPNRNCDWCVYEDGQEELRRQGWGATPVDALMDYIENYMMEEGGEEND